MEKEFPLPFKSIVRHYEVALRTYNEQTLGAIADDEAMAANYEGAYEEQINNLCSNFAYIWRYVRVNKDTLMNLCYISSQNVKPIIVSDSTNDSSTNIMEFMIAASYVTTPRLVNIVNPPNRIYIPTLRARMINFENSLRRILSQNTADVNENLNHAYNIFVKSKGAEIVEEIIANIFKFEPNGKRSAVEIANGSNIINKPVAEIIAELTYEP